MVLILLLEVYQGSVDGAFLVVTVLVVVVMHEGLHMVGMEALRLDHSESFRLLVVGYAATITTSTWKVMTALLLPFAVFFPLGAYLILQGGAVYVALGWSMVVVHAILLPIELVSMRAKSAE